jgi:SAM-dependent methyltransferase
MSAAPDAATPVVSAFYDRFPYPGDPLQDGPPPGYNWRWCVDSARAFVFGCLPPGPRTWRILDAGCGTGVSTDYLCHLNPGSRVRAVDISAGAIEVARERTRRSGAAAQVADLAIEQRSLLDLSRDGTGAGGPGRTARPGGRSASFPVCGWRPLGDPSHPAGPGPDGGGHR